MNHDDVVRLAEQGTLGALMLRPDALEQVRRWLRPDDFADLWHTQVYTALLERHHVGGLDPNSMAAVLLDRLGPRVADLPRFTQLLTATPPDPQPLAYARMVADGGLRRETAGLGVLLQASALNAVTHADPAPLTTTCAVVDADLDLVGARWAQATGRPHDDVVVPLHLRAATRNTGLAARTAADKYLQAHPLRDPDAEHAHLVALVGTLIAHPDLVPDVVDWLPPTRVEDPGWRAVYGTTIELAELGQRVDLTTVAWAAHAHAHHGPDLPALEDLTAAVEAGWYAHPPQVIRQVAADQVRHLADVGAGHLRAAATNPATLVGDLVDAGHAITSALRITATALAPQTTAVAAASPNPTGVGRDAGQVVSR
ncbi:DnaB-like helicase N-terminal domain-containing protein [Cellulomonas soli]|uniref:DNA helicase DnaB-like N-terminal domain-containing protein n=1 Tax=Cellulomonas soli TaxID=931535 RepID=A0A512P9E1_9CELL|nr:DnaB-like helicase N-terminal domain-containing protein [Cellulomonas soli]NYI60305.1 hypothetical protein [Cellulomonas soli]GEP67815.1 hypothetical protein CSO01_05300 [Cellulomonas soli]